MKLFVLDLMVPVEVTTHSGVWDVFWASITSGWGSTCASWGWGGSWYSVLTNRNTNRLGADANGERRNAVCVGTSSETDIALKS